MKALIVDDTRLARKELRYLLEQIDDIVIVGEAAHADEAQEKIVALCPDVVFLDIQMPGRNGFELLESLDRVPEVIFTTAYDAYALKAFEYNALDYLQKPIQFERLEQAVEKVRLSSTSPSTEADADTPPSSMLSSDDRVFVKDGDFYWFVPISDIRLLEVDGSYTRIRFDTHQPMIPKSLNHLESRLDPRLFFRANRQQIVNLRWVDQVAPWFSGGLKLMLRGGEEVEVSRRQASRFKELMSL
ncbi:MAG: LytTR family DNA-binding domain-containing protein [Puniceicoccaceae bacterium]